MNKVILIIVFCLVGFGVAGQVSKRDTIPFNESNTIEIQSSNTNAELLDIVAKELVSQGFMFREFNKEYFYLRTYLLVPFGKSKEQEYYVFIDKSKIKIFSGVVINGLGNIRAEFSNRERGTVASDMYKEMMVTVASISQKLNNVKIYHLKN